MKFVCNGSKKFLKCEWAIHFMCPRGICFASPPKSQCIKERACLRDLINTDDISTKIFGGLLMLNTFLN